MNKKNKTKFSEIYKVVVIIIFIILSLVFIISATRENWNARSLAKPSSSLTNFTYEIEGGESGTAKFPYSFKNLSPSSEITINVKVNPETTGSILVKTVYTKLRLYADDVLIYECGDSDNYPKFLLDPPTLLQIVPLPENTSNLRFEYISPSQRSTMSVPAVLVGSDGELLANLFTKNSVILILSMLFVLFGIAMILFSLFYWSKGKIFINIGLFAISVGLWSLGECNATAFIIPYPVLLYFIAFGGFFNLTIPLFKYILLILKPKTPVIMNTFIRVAEIAVLIALILQLTGKVALSKSLYFFQLFVTLEIIIFVITTVWELFRSKNKRAKQFLLPSFVLLIGTLLELANYTYRFTNILSLFLLLAIFVFTLMLAIIGIKKVIIKQKEIEKIEAKTKFYHQMSHDLLTPLTIVSTNVQIAKMIPEETNELLSKSQDEIMKMADMINSALDDDEVNNI